MREKPTASDRSSGPSGTLRGRRLLLARLVFLFFMLIVTFVGIVAVEIAMGAYYRDTTAALFTCSLDTRRYKVMLPNVRAKVYGVPIETNAEGFRARRVYSVEKDREVHRILVIGDSFTIGAGVPFEELATTRLEGLLHSAYPGEKFEIYNLACGGHEFLHHAATLEEVGLGYDPDLVLLFSFPYNDFEALNYDADRRRAEEMPLSKESLIPPRHKLAWYKNLYVYRAFFGRIRGIADIFGVRKRQFGHKLIHGLENRTSAVERSIEALGEIERLTTAARIPLRVFLLPVNTGTYEEQIPAERLVQEAFRDVGLEAESVIDAFAATGQAPSKYALKLIDSHPNGAYHEVLARAVFERLDTSGEIDAWIAAEDAASMQSLP